MEADYPSASQTGEAAGLDEVNDGNSGNETDGILFDQPDPLNQLIFNIQHLLTSVRALRRKDCLEVKTLRKEVKLLNATGAAAQHEKKKLLKLLDESDDARQREQRNFKKLEKEVEESHQARKAEHKEARSALRELEIIDQSLIVVHKRVVKLVSDTAHIN